MNAGAARHLQRVLDTRTIDAEAAQWIIAGLTAWLRPGAELKLPACMGLPTSAARTRKALRDVYLIDAAASLPGGPHMRATAILAHTRRFANQRRRRWAVTGIPENASREEVALARAFFTGAQMPDCVEAFRKILAGADRPNKSGRDFGANACSDKARTDHKGQEQS
ncbi:MAG TPA: hypothetical protein PKD77_12160 [Rudaea sp.]|nr:hypothetical protein [Rudaea sp.]